MSLYRVYNKKGDYHHSYSDLEDAICCAKYVLGFVQEVLNPENENASEKMEVKVFDATKGYVRNN